MDVRRCLRFSLLILPTLLPGCAKAGVDYPPDGGIREGGTGPRDSGLDARMDSGRPPTDADRGRDGSCASHQELCNAADDDCDGEVDEDLGLGMPCDGMDSDACAEGTTVCGTDGMVACTDSTSGSIETCNGIDDDCRSGVDQGFPVGVACTSGVGACARPGVYQCDPTGEMVVCSGIPELPTEEFCGDGVDQDCDGSDVLCPVNDRPEGAVDISSGGTFTVDVRTAHNDQDWRGMGCGSTGGRDVFYKFTLTSPQVVYYDTFGSNFDTVIRVFAGPCTALGAHRACADDACGVTQSQGAVSLEAGEYCMVADQYSTTQSAVLGALVLNFRLGGQVADPLPSGEGGSVSGSTCAADNSSTATCQAATSAGDVAHYFLVCPGTSQMVNASTCGSPVPWDSVLYLRKVGGIGDVACNDDGGTASCSAGSARLSSISNASAEGPGLFLLVVDGFGGACGGYTLDYQIR